MEYLRLPERKKIVKIREKQFIYKYIGKIIFCTEVITTRIKKNLN